VQYGIGWGLLGLASLGGVALAEEGDVSRVAATVVEQATPSVGSSEGWVLLSRCIDKDGRVVDPVVMDSSGQAALEQAARNGARESKYTAATLDGTAIDSCDQDVLVAFQSDAADHTASPEFLAAWKRAESALEAKHYDEALKILDGIENWNTEEGIRLAMMRAEIARAQHDDATQLQWLMTVIDGPTNVSADMAADLLRRAFALQVQAQQYAAALAIFEKLQALQGVELTAGEQKAGAQLQALPDGDAAFATPGRLDARFAGADQPPTWSTRLLRREFAFANAEGNPDRFELRCENKHYRATFDTENQWRVPDSWGACWLIVFGPADATFKLVEVPKAPAAS
jgi:hypothetical protein